jgi:hypothetical protein
MLHLIELKLWTELKKITYSSLNIFSIKFMFSSRHICFETSFIEIKRVYVNILLCQNRKRFTRTIQIGQSSITN